MVKHTVLPGTLQQPFQLKPGCSPSCWQSWGLVDRCPVVWRRVERSQQREEAAHLPAGFLSFVPALPAPLCSCPSGDSVRRQNISPLAQAGDLCPCRHPSLRVPRKVGTGGLLGQPRQLAPHAHLEGESRVWHPSKHLRTRPWGVLTVQPPVRPLTVSNVRMLPVLLWYQLCRFPCQLNLPFFPFLFEKQESTLKTIAIPYISTFLTADTGP